MVVSSADGGDGSVAGRVVAVAGGADQRWCRNERYHINESRAVACRVRAFEFNGVRASAQMEEDGVELQICSARGRDGADACAIDENIDRLVAAWVHIATLRGKQTEAVVPGGCDVDRLTGTAIFLKEPYLRAIWRARIAGSEATLIACHASATGVGPGCPRRVVSEVARADTGIFKTTVRWPAAIDKSHTNRINERRAVTSGWCLEGNRGASRHGE